LNYLSFFTAHPLVFPAKAGKRGITGIILAYARALFVGIGKCYYRQQPQNDLKKKKKKKKKHSILIFD